MSIKTHFTSPLAISMLAHYAARHEPYLDLPFAQWPDKNKDTILAFIQADLIRLHDKPEHETHYVLADKGYRVLQSIKWAITSQLRKQERERGKHRDF